MATAFRRIQTIRFLSCTRLSLVEQGNLPAVIGGQRHFSTQVAEQDQSVDTSQRPEREDAIKFHNLSGFYNSQIELVNLTLEQHANQTMPDPRSFEIQLDDLIKRKRYRRLRAPMLEMKLLGMRPSMDMYKKALLAASERQADQFTEVQLIRRDMERAGYFCNDQINAATIVSAAMARRFTYADEFAQDLDRWGQGDTHRMRRAKVILLVEQGKTEECFAIVAEAAAKQDPYLLHLYREIMHAAERKVLLELGKRDRAMAVHHIDRVIQEASEVFDFQEYPRDKDVLTTAAVRILNRIGYHTEVERYYNQISWPTNSTKQCLFTSHVKLGIVDVPGLKQDEKDHHLEKAIILLEELKSEGVALRPEAINVVIQVCVKFADKLEPGSSLNLCEDFIAFLKSSGGYVSWAVWEKVKSTTIHSVTGKQLLTSVRDLVR